MRTLFPMIRGLRNPGLLIGAFSLALSASAGCGGPEVADAEAEVTAPAIANLLVSLPLRDGRQVDFFEPQAGRVVILGSGAMPELDGKISPVALYEALSGGAAPLVLVQAEERAAVARAFRAEQAAASVASVMAEPKIDQQRAAVPRAGVASSLHALSATDFQSSYCPGGSYNFFYCWTNRTGNATIEVSSVDWLRTYANAYRGQVLLKLSYKNLWGTWITLASVSVPEGTVKTLYTSSNDTYQTKIDQAAGDGYHFSVYGDK